MGDGNPSPASSFSLFSFLATHSGHGVCAIFSPNPTATGSSDHRWKPLETEVKRDLSLLKVDYFRHFVTATHSTFDRVSGSGSHDN